MRLRPVLKSRTPARLPFASVPNGVSLTAITASLHTILTCAPHKDGVTDNDAAHSSNMLNPREDQVNSQLVFECLTCHYIDKATVACIYRNSLKEDVAETAGNTEDVLEDPTVGAASASFARMKVDPRSGERYMDDEEEDDRWDEEMQDMQYSITEAQRDDVEPIMCTMCGQEILCPTCGRPTDRCLAYEVEDQPGPASKEDVRRERMERTLSSAGHAS